MTISKFIAVQGTIKIIKISELPRRGNMIVEKKSRDILRPSMGRTANKKQSISLIPTLCDPYWVGKMGMNQIPTIISPLQGEM